MARNRMIKPEFWTSRQVIRCSPWARLLFVGLWNFSDDGGNHPNCAVRLKVEIFPGDAMTPKDVGGYLAELIECGLVSTYTVAGEEFTHVTGWQHQTIKHPTYRHPPPPGEETSTVALPEDGALNETKRNETTLRKVTSNYVKSNQTFRTYDRTFERKVLELDWERVYDRCRVIHARISEHKGPQEMCGPNPVGERGKWDMPKDFREKLIKAAAIVEAEFLPPEWLDDVIGMFVESVKKKPGGWLGKVLASTAREKYGVDFDSFKRSIHIPEGE